MINYKDFDKQVENAIKKMGEFEEDMVKEIADESHRLGKQVQAKAKTNARSQGLDNTGELVRGIRVRRPTKRNKRKKYIVSRVITTTRHGVAWELGHKRHVFGRPTSEQVPARPYLRPAGDSFREQIQSAITRIIDRWIKKVVKK